MQTVKQAILKPALRAVQQETNSAPAEDGDYTDAFNFLIEMYEFWQSRGIFLWSSPPPNMNAGVSTEDPTYTMWTNLVLHISSHFAYDPTMKQSTAAAQSFRVLRNRQKGKALMNCPKNMPRGTGNTYLRNWICIDDECNDLINDQEAKLIAGV